MNEPGISKERYLQIARRFGLTARQLELGYLKVSGFSNRRIAYMLGISEQTVKNHFTAIYERHGFPEGRNSKSYSPIMAGAADWTHKTGAVNENK